MFIEMMEDVILHLIFLSMLCIPFPVSKKSCINLWIFPKLKISCPALSSVRQDLINRIKENLNTKQFAQYFESAPALFLESVLFLPGWAHQQ